MPRNRNINTIVIWICLITIIGIGSLTLLLEHLEKSYRTTQSAESIALLSSQTLSLKEAIAITKLQLRFSKLDNNSKVHWTKLLNSIDETDNSHSPFFEQFLKSRTACYHSLKTLDRKKNRTFKLGSTESKNLKRLMTQTCTRIESGEITAKHLKPILVPLYSILSNKNQPAQSSPQFAKKLLKSLSRLDKLKVDKDKITDTIDLTQELETALKQLEAKADTVNSDD